MVTRRRDETGAQIAEAAVAIPIAIAIFLAVIQIGLEGFQRASLQAQLHHAAVAVDLSAVAAADEGPARERAFAAAVSQGAVGIDESRLSVESLSLEESVETTSAEIDPKGSGYDRIRSTSAVVRATAEVVYEMPSVGAVTFGPREIRIPVDVEQTVQGKVEVL